MSSASAVKHHSKVHVITNTMMKHSKDLISPQWLCQAKTQENHKHILSFIKYMSSMMLARNYFYIVYVFNNIKNLFRLFCLVYFRNHTGRIWCIDDILRMHLARQQCRAQPPEKHGVDCFSCSPLSFYWLNVFQWIAIVKRCITNGVHIN